MGSPPGLSDERGSVLIWWMLVLGAFIAVVWGLAVGAGMGGDAKAVLTTAADSAAAAVAAEMGVSVAAEVSWTEWFCTPDTGDGSTCTQTDAGSGTYGAAWSETLGCQGFSAQPPAGYVGAWRGCTADLGAQTFSPAPDAAAAAQAYFARNVATDSVLIGPEITSIQQQGPKVYVYATATARAGLLSVLTGKPVRVNASGFAVARAGA